jgi:hypothetical protein
LDRRSDAELGVLVERIGVELMTRGDHENACLCWRIGLALAGIRAGEAPNPPRLYLGRYIPRE